MVASAADSRDLEEARVEVQNKTVQINIDVSALQRRTDCSFEATYLRVSFRLKCKHAKQVCLAGPDFVLRQALNIERPLLTSSNSTHLNPLLPVLDPSVQEFNCENPSILFSLSHTSRNSHELSLSTAWRTNLLPPYTARLLTWPAP